MSALIVPFGGECNSEVDTSASIPRVHVGPLWFSSWTRAHEACLHGGPGHRHDEGHEIHPGGQVPLRQR